MEQRPLTLLEFNRHIKNVLNREVGGEYWVVAEIGDLKLHSSGHCYLELLEKKENTLLAKIRATIWASTYQSMAPWFKDQTGEPLRNGLKVLVAIRVNFHEVYGLSLNVVKIDPSYTLGERARKRKEILEKLEKEGLLELNKQKRLASVPLRIAVVSSEMAAGYEDFINQLHANRYGYQFSIKLYPSLLQGEQAITSIQQTMTKIEASSQDYDVIVWIRGGGSQLDLDTFDTYELGKVIADSTLPVITGIGHQRDETIADLLAYSSVKTPTAAAEFLIRQVLSFEETIVNTFDRICTLATGNINVAKIHTDKLFSRLELISGRIIDRQSAILDRLETGIKYSFKERLKGAHHRIDMMESELDKHNPEFILKKGYSLSSIDGIPINRVTGPILGKKLVTLSEKNVIYSQITETEQRDGK